MIQPIVEGQGDVKAFPVLLRRLVERSGNYEIQINSPVRRKRYQLIDRNELSKSVRIALERPGTQAVLILFDADGDCPLEIGPQIKELAQAECGVIPCEVVVAKEEYESWFLAAIDSLRGKYGIDATAYFEGDPERPRGAKERISLIRPYGYSPTVDQAKLSSAFDLAAAYRRCRSFRKLTSAFGNLVKSLGLSVAEWPPSNWIA